MDPKEFYSEYQATLEKKRKTKPEENSSQLSMPFPELPVSGGFLG